MKYLGPTSSGSIEDVTHSHNRYGQYTRRRATPINRRTLAQTRVRLNFGQASAAWRNLTSVQRSGWEAWATAHPIVDVLGQTQVLTGIAFFVGVQALLLRTAQPMILAPPSAEPVWPTVSATVSSLATGPVLDLTFSGLVVGSGLILEMASPRSDPFGFVSGWRFVAPVVASSTSPLNLTTTYTTLFGAPSVGQWVPYRVRQVWWGVGVLPWTANAAHTT